MRWKERLLFRVLGIMIGKSLDVGSTNEKAISYRLALSLNFHPTVNVFFMVLVFLLLLASSIRFLCAQSSQSCTEGIE